MTDSCNHVYIQLVWATKQRAPLLQPDLEERVRACIASKCAALKCQVIAIGGTEDHIHILSRLHSTLAVANLAHGLKGASSHFVTHVLERHPGFKWQHGYGAFSVSISHLRQVIEYIEHQKEHHAQETLWPHLERCTDDEPAGP